MNLSDDAFGKLCALLAAVAWAIGVPLLRRGSRSLHPVSSCIIRNLSAAPLFFVLLAIQHAPAADALANLPWQRHLLFVLSGVIGISLADTCFFLGARHLQIGVIGLAQTIYSPLVVILSAVFLGERLSGIQLFGDCLVVSSTVLVKSALISANDPGKNEKFGLLCMLLCVISNVAAVLIVKVAIEDFPVLVLMPYRMLSGVLPLVLWAAWQDRQGPVHRDLRNTSAWLGILPGAFFGSALSATLWILGFAYTKASLAALINESSAFFLLLIGWLVYREEISRIKFIAASLAAVGLCLLWL